MAPRYPTGDGKDCGGAVRADTEPGFPEDFLLASRA